MLFALGGHFWNPGRFFTFNAAVLRNLVLVQQERLSKVQRKKAVPKPLSYFITSGATSAKIHKNETIFQK